MNTETTLLAFIIGFSLTIVAPGLVHIRKSPRAARKEKTHEIVIAAACFAIGCAALLLLIA